MRDSVFAKAYEECGGDGTEAAVQTLTYYTDKITDRICPINSVDIPFLAASLEKIANEFKNRMSLAQKEAFYYCMKEIHEECIFTEEKNE